MMKRATYTIPEELMDRIEEHCQKTGLKKSALVTMGMTQYLDGQKMMATMPDMLNQMKELMESANREKGTAAKNSQ